MATRFVRHRPASPDKVTARDLLEVQERCGASIEQLERKAHLVDSELLENITLVSASTNLVSHQLGRAVRGWRVGRLDAAATIYEDKTFSTDRTKFLPLVTSANCVVSLEVY